MFGELFERQFYLQMLLLVSVLCAFGGMVACLPSLQLVLGGLRSEGIILRLEERRDKEGAIAKIPIFSFRDATGVEHTLESSFVSPSRRAGQLVPVLYMPGEPATAQIACFAELWGVATVLGIIALLSLTGAVLVHRPRPTSNAAC
ncbi:MAG TPA: DUF3592 domain-containing protein [Chthoniobacteraceae bacterium]|nr:DUF3592 domain-containing protein [Chthoniobacteraceae bacterium]